MVDTAPRRQKESINGGARVPRSPGPADIITTLPFLQHLFAGLQGCSGAKKGLFKLHLGEKQTAIEKSLLFLSFSW